MARIRTIKPGFFRHADLYDAEVKHKLPLRIAFAGLWTAADREGRFAWKPRSLKLDCLPFDDVDFGAVLDALAAEGFLIKYKVGADTFGCIPSWSKHQQVNSREATSDIPAHDEASASTCTHMPGPVQEPGEQEQEGKGTGREREAREKIFSPLKTRTTWPSEAVVPDGWITIAAQQRRLAGLPEIDLEVAARMFANHYAADTQNPRTMTEFQAKWNNWALKEKPANGSRTGAKSQLEQLADIVRSSQVASG